MLIAPRHVVLEKIVVHIRILLGKALSLGSVRFKFGHAHHRVQIGLLPARLVFVCCHGVEIRSTMGIGEEGRRVDGFRGSVCHRWVFHQRFGHLRTRSAKEHCVFLTAE